MTTTKKRNPLAALTGAALALPAIAQLAHADSAPVKTEVGYRYSNYQEDELSRSQILIGDTERYEVDNHAFRLVTPLNAQWGLTVDAAYETMSGASAMAIANDPQGEPKLIMTGASIDDKRTDVSANLRHYHEEGSIAVSVGWSDEKDYTAYNVGLEAELQTADRQGTWSAGLGYSSDEIEPVQEAGINRPVSEDKSSVNTYVAYTQILNAGWQVQGGLFAGVNDGYLADAYKARDIRPDERQMFGAVARSRYFMPDVKAALHADYRYYSDDWGINSHTLEFTWHQSLSDRWRLVPLLRYYSQSQADFYVDSDSVSRAGDQSSDYRLSPYGAVTYGLGLVYQETDWRLSLNGERYDSDGDLALESVDQENPMLVSYTLLSVGVDYRF